MDFTVFSTQNSRYLAEKICARLGKLASLKNIERWQFDDGEQYYRLDIEKSDALMGKDVIFVGSTHTDDDLLELYRVGCGLAEHGTRRRIFIIPFFGYSTMERAVKPGEIVTAKKNAHLLSAIPNTGLGNIFLFLDLHTPGLVHYFEGNCLRYEVNSEPILVEAIKELNLSEMIFASADLGRPRRVKSFADLFETDIALISKTRQQKDTFIDNVIGNVKGKTVIIYDDMTRSGGTIAKAAEAYMNQGASQIYAVLSHLAPSNKEAIEKLAQMPVVKIISTNSHPATQSPGILNSEKFIIKDVSGIFAQAIKQLG